MPHTVAATRGTRPESRPRVPAAVVDPDARLVASAADPALITFRRSVPMPLQAMPLVDDQAVARDRSGDRELALACASQSSGLARPACGSHPPLSPEIGEYVLRPVS